MIPGLKENQRLRCLIAVGYTAMCISGCSSASPSKSEGSRSKNFPSAESSSISQRFVFPSKSQPFPDASVALDAETGQLCKTYAWQDIPQLPQGLPVCANASSSARASSDAAEFIGSQTTYLGYTYTFDGKAWQKGGKALRYDSTGAFVGPVSYDPFDPLGLSNKEGKSKHLLTQEEIIRTATKFGVSYEAVWADAKARGYQVPAPYSRDNPFVPH